MVCFNCQDNGIVGGCPVCEKEQVLVKYVAEIENPLVREEAFSIIPESYRQDWDSNILRQTYLDYENDSEFNLYIKHLDSLIDLLRKGKLPQQSALIMSSAGMGKTHFAYCCMMLAASYGYTIGPLIDTTQYRRLNNISMDPITFRNYVRANPTTTSIDDVLNSDLQFLYVDPTCFKDAHRDIMSLVLKRDRLGKPTIILSMNTVNQITVSDYEKDFKRFLMNREFSKQKQIRVLNMFMR